MIRYPRRQRKLQVVGLASLATLLLVSVALFVFGAHQLVHLGRPATYRLNILVDPALNRQVLARRIAAEARKRSRVIELSARVYPSLEALKLVNDPNPIDMALVPEGVGGPDRFSNVRSGSGPGDRPAARRSFDNPMIRIIERGSRHRFGHRSTQPGT